MYFIAKNVFQFVMEKRYLYVATIATFFSFSFGHGYNTKFALCGKTDWRQTKLF